jgi:hypothetical protein
LEGTKCPEDTRLSLAVTYLDGKARDFWDSREVLLKMRESGEVEDPIITMAHFTQAMIGAYGNLDPVMVA